MDNFSIRTKIYFGDDVLDHLGELDCKKALIVTDPFIVTSGLLDMIVHPLENAKIDFLSRMSHDLRTPLNAVITLSNLAVNENDVIKLRKD